MEKAGSGPLIVGDGMIRSEADFEKYFKLPPVDEPSIIQNMREFVEHREEFCAVACVRLGIGATLLSMGIEAFSYAMVDTPSLIRAVHGGYAEWTEKIIPILEDIGFDAVWAFDDVAYDSGPIFSPAFYREEILPVEKKVARSISIPLITHSDGDMGELLSLWIELGQSAIHPIQPNVMAIYDVRDVLPQDIGIVGNIDMELLSRGTPDQVEDLIKERFERLKPTRNYLISSSNSLTDDMKEENVRAMIKAVKEHGWY
jgi:uroporphyrinogen decarboxylase